MAAAAPVALTFEHDGAGLVQGTEVRLIFPVIDTAISRPPLLPELASVRPALRVAYLLCVRFVRRVSQPPGTARSTIVGSRDPSPCSSQQVWVPSESGTYIVARLIGPKPPEKGDKGPEYIVEIGKEVRRTRPPLHRPITALFVVFALSGCFVLPPLSHPRR